MFKKITVLFLISIFMMDVAVLYSLEPLHLAPLIKEAQERNPGIQAAKKRWEASLARIPQAKSLDNPSLGVTFEKIPRGTFQLNNTMPDDRMLSVQQMFPFFGKLPLKGKIALVESQMAASEYKGKELEIVNKLKTAYYDLFMADKEIELNQQSLKLLESIVKIAETRYAVGDTAQEEVFKLHLEIARLNTNIANLKQEKSARQTSLNTLLNRDPESPVGIPLLAEDASFKADIKSLYASTLLNQPELVIFSYAIEKNKFAKALAKKSFLPDMMSGLALRGISSGATGPWDLMLAFTLPLWFWTKQRYEIKEAIANLEEAEAAYKAMQNKAFSEVKDLYAKIGSAGNKINLYKNNLIPVLESSISVSLAGFRSGGNADFMMLLDNERMLIETKMQYYKALVEYNTALADLERAIGIGLE